MMKTSLIDPSVMSKDSIVHKSSQVREYVTLRGVEIAEQCKIYERVSLKRVRVGKRVDINAGTYIENTVIADDVMIGPNSTIVGVTHEISSMGAKREDVFKRITIQQGVFIGANVTLLPGVTIGANSVLAAGAIVTKDIPSNVIVIGSPPNQSIKPLPGNKSESFSP